MLKFRADRIRINASEERDHLAQRHLAAVEKKLRRNLEIEILLAKAKLAQTQQRILRAFVGQRIEPRDRVPERAVGVNQSVHSRLERTLADFGGRRSGRGRAVAQTQIAQLKTFEERGPIGIDRFRILLPALVIFLEQIEVHMGGERGTHGGFNLQGIRRHGKLTVPTPFRYLAAK